MLKKNNSNTKFLIVFVCLLSAFLLSTAAMAAENCGQSGGVCRKACLATEAAESGAFLDCEDKDECCMPKPATADFKCCIHSYGQKSAGPANCSLPATGQCVKGTGSPAPCSALLLCK